MTDPADYDLEAVRAEWIGKSSGEGPLSRYPAEYEPIKRHMRMVRDENPLYYDIDYAEAGPYGAVIVPPPMSGSAAGGGSWPPRKGTGGGGLMFAVPTLGDRYINMNTSYEYLKPVRVGDRLSSETVVVDIFQKPIRLDPKAIWVVTENRYRNQHGELVHTWRNTVLSHRTPEEVASDPDAAKEASA